MPEYLWRGRRGRRLAGEEERVRSVAAECDVVLRPCGVTTNKVEHTH